MILIWRGSGLLGTLGFVAALAAIASLGNVDPPWIHTVVMAEAFLLAGAGCVVVGTLWNRTRVEHSLYGVPLQFWGWLQLVLAGAIALVEMGDALIDGGGRPNGAAIAIPTLVAGSVLGAVVGLVQFRRRIRPGVGRPGGDRRD